ncbi:hypothetical protein ACH50O_17395 [Methylomonas sp. 2BW1-5-20]|uniref:hypothetical protein n=1 Tax=Methylomonas sp. 2BW1-5-20 TaxID=3376686 RepID=UPI00404FC036
MPTKNDMLWFKNEFHQKIEAAVSGSPFTLDMLTAIASQETGYIWGILRSKGLPTATILELCVGDTLDRTKNFPKDKDDLVKVANGDKMFDIARRALLDMANETGDKVYLKVSKNPDKFCHGFGIFQYDIQFFKNSPDYFLNKEYADFDRCLSKCLEELRRGLKRIGLDKNKVLTNLEMAAVAIAYNTGGYNPRKGIRQGYYDKDNDKYYGEYFFDYLRLAQTVAISDGSASLAPPKPGRATIANPSPITATGPIYEVDVQHSPLRLRSEPKIDNDNSNVLTHLPDGHIVQAVTNRPDNGFLEVETYLLGAHFHGYLSAQYLKPAPAGSNVTVTIPSTTLPASGIVAVYMPRKAGTITQRTQPAGAHSLNEPRQPGRQGTTPDELRKELVNIISWLAVDNPAHLRYQPNSGSTFCNVYAHDFCHLAGIYLPRVWWSQAAIVDLTKGKAVQPAYGKTIDELRANDLFRWLRDFGPDFGWRQTSTLTKLQTEVNQGAVGLIVARRVQNGKPGHIVVVVPETTNQSAQRNATGDVTAPLQSQAGSTNFQYGTGKKDWWKGAQFAESGFWLHA